MFSSRKSETQDDEATKRRKGKGRRSAKRPGSAVRTRYLEQLEDRMLLSITLNSDHLQLTLDGGSITGVADPAYPATNYCIPGGYPFAWVNGTQAGSTSCVATPSDTDPTQLSFGMSNGGNVTVGVQKRGGVNNTAYFVFTITGISSLPNEVDLDLFTTITGHNDNLAVVAANDSFAVFDRPLSPAVNATVWAGSGPGRFFNSFDTPAHMIGASIAVGGCSYTSWNNGTPGGPVLSAAPEYDHQRRTRGLLGHRAVGLECAH